MKVFIVLEDMIIDIGRIKNLHPVVTEVLINPKKDGDSEYAPIVFQKKIF